MIKGLLGEIGGILKFLFWGFLFSVFFIYSCTERTIQSVQESAVPLSEVNVVPSFEIKDYGAMVDVYTDAKIETTHAIKDFTATLHLYDCATADTPVSQCTDLGSDYKVYDDVQSSKSASWVFNFYSLPARNGVLVPKLEITNPRG